MRFIFLILFLPVIMITTGLHSAAQGSLGDPVYTYDFGSGSNPGPPLGSSYTNMSYITGCPEDGQYTIANSLGNPSCYSAWRAIPTDHTGNPNGYMMVINASYSPSVFFTAPVDVSYLCPNTTYRFTVYIANLYLQSAGNAIEPNITFNVTTAGGTQIATPTSTGNIAPNADGASPWVPYSVDFTTPANLTSVIVSLTNNADGGIGNDLALDDISVSPYGPKVTAQFTPGSSPAAICQGDRATYSFSTSIQANVFTDPAEQWQENINGAGWVDLPNETQQTLSIQNEFNPAGTPGTYQYRLGVAEKVNINSPQCRVYSDPVTITVNPAVTAIVSSAEQSECEGDVLTLNATGGVTYQWTGPNMQPTAQNPLVIPNVSLAGAGTYTVTAFSQYCSSVPVSTKVIVFPKADAVVKGNATICEGTSTPLSASGGVTYAWSPGKSLSDSTIADPVASPTDNTIYKVTVTDANGCQDSAKVTVDVLKAPIADAGPKRIIFEGQSIRINATAKYTSSVYWTPTTGLSDPNILNPVASPTSDIKYTLHANSAQGCGTDTSSVFIRVYQHIIIPNTFSPNNDGVNDLWNIDALITYPESLMLIFDRYGQQVYKSVGYSKPWDGTYDGKPVPPGTYYYVLDLKNNTPEIAGYVMVVR